MSYKHLSIVEREKILIYLTQGLSLCQIANLLEKQELFALVKKSLSK